MTASEQPGLPMSGATTSYWQAEYADSTIHDHGRDDDLPTEVVDVAIVGSGISGAVAAYMLQENGDGHGDADRTAPSIVMLEARQACSGATGRNGGHCRPDVFLGYKRYAAIVGKEQSRKVLANEWETYRLMGEMVEREQLDCDWWTGETLAVFRSEELREAVQTLLGEYKAVVESEEGIPQARFVADVEESRKISRVKDAVGVAIWPAASLQPLRFVHELIKRCLERPNFRLYTHTPVIRLDNNRGEGLWSVETGRGTVRARKVLLATNGYSAALLPTLKNFLTPHRAQCSAITPPDNFVRQHALMTTASIIKSKGDYEYLTQQPSQGGVNPPRGQKGRAGSGAFILGGGHPYAPHEEQVDTLDDTVVITAIRDHLAAFPKRTFVDWQSNVEQLTNVWTGIQGYTKDSLPLVGEHFEEGYENLFLCLGHHGHGMARAATCARGVAREMLANGWKSQEGDGAISDAEWERETGLPGCYRWTRTRQMRDDVDCRGDL